MNTKLIFSDESSDIRKSAGSIYVRSCVLFTPEQYKEVSDIIRHLKNYYEIPLDVEFKYNYLWLLKNNSKCKDPNYLLFKEKGYEKMLGFVEDVFFNTSSLYFETISVFTKFLSDNFASKYDKIEKDMLHVIMQRIEYSCRPDNLGILYYDDINNKNLGLADSYRTIFMDSEFVKSYSNIKDSLSFEYSQYSAGMQFVDLIVGITRAYLRGFPESKELFYKYLIKKIRVKDINKIASTGFIPLYMGIGNLPEFREKVLLDLINKLN